MKIGVISDIHSNVIAFEECIRYLEHEKCDEYLFLGDYVSDTPYTRETMDLLYSFIGSHKCRLLKGNREEYMLSQRNALKLGTPEQKWIYNSASGNLLYTYELLTEEDLDFFESLPISFDYEYPGFPAIKCSHGSPAGTRELIQLGSSEAKEWLERIPQKYMICAHTHHPGEFSFNGKHYFNPGCVGISIDDAGFAECMILHDDTEDGEIVWKPEFLRIPYDNQKVVDDIKKCGLMEKAHWFINSNIQILLTGEDNAAALVELACRLSSEAGETAVWPHIDEKYFALAAKKLGIPDYRDSDSQ